MKKLIIACVAIGVAVGAGVWAYTKWNKDKKSSISEDEVSAQSCGQSLGLDRNYRTKNFRHSLLLAVNRQAHEGV